jgi:P4 family phage/plasmid primase-like protien
MTTLTLRSYLDSRYTTSAADCNITGWGAGWAGKYAIPDDEYDAFLRLAHDHVFVRGKAYSLLEKHKSNGPILIDLDFKYPAGGPLRRRFTTENLRNFVAAYADAVARFFEPPSAPLQFFVMLKPAPEADAAHDQHKDGVHIVCPTLTLPPETQYAIRGYLLQTGAVERIFGDTGNVQAPQEVLDLSVIARNNWFLYGACKPDKAWYKVQHIYAAAIPDEREEPTGPWITSDHLEEEAADGISTLELVRLLSIRNGHDAQTPMTLRTADAATEVEWLQLLQRWGKGSNWAKPKSPGLSARAAPAAGGGGAAVDLPPMQLGGVAAADDMIQISGRTVRSNYTTEDIALAHRLARECLHAERRCGEYQDWVNMALCLKNISDTDDSYRVWMDLTRRTGAGHKKSQMSDADLKRKWEQLPAESAAMRAGRKPLLMGTLHHWAKEDAPASYRAIIGDSNRELAMNNDSGTHVSVAEQVVNMYRHEFRCTPARKGAAATAMDWYQFDAHTWRSLKTWMRLRERLSNEVRNIYIQADREVGNRITQASTEDERQRLESKRKNLFAVEKSLQNTGFKDSVMKETAEKFYDEEFLQYMNQDTTTVGFSNGVLELRHPGGDGRPHIFFRPGRPDDCISFQMGRGIVSMDAIPYIPYDPNAPAPEHLELQDFFSKIYPDPVLKEYAMTLYAACLEGANHEQKFYIMSGSGGNGKSKIIDLMSKTFGEYQESLPVTALTRKRADAGSANPEMIVLKCRRFISMVEPEEGERINTSLMKQLSGQDTLKARGLFQDQDQFIVTARIFMSCNELPAVSSMDQGTWRRLRVIPHVSTFVEEGRPTDPSRNVYPRDPLLDSKIGRWRPYFAGMMAWYYENKYLRGGLKEPAQVTAASDRYKEENDSFVSFAQECLVREIGAETKIADVLARYKDWHRFNPGKKQMQKPAIVQKMTELYGKPIDSLGRTFAGVRMAIEGEDVSGNYVNM